MALSRTEDFTRKENNVSDFAKALSHPARLSILMTLANREECICGDLVLDLPLAQSTVSQHLKALKEMGLVKGTVDGPRSRYCLDWKVFSKYQRKLADWTERMIKLRADNCC